MFEEDYDNTKQAPDYYQGFDDYEEGLSYNHEKSQDWQKAWKAAESFWKN